jgi:hypothetical protein
MTEISEQARTAIVTLIRDELASLAALALAFGADPDDVRAELARRSARIRGDAPR